MEQIWNKIPLSFEIYFCNSPVSNEFDIIMGFIVIQWEFTMGYRDSNVLLGTDWLDSE